MSRRVPIETSSVSGVLRNNISANDRLWIKHDIEQGDTLHTAVSLARNALHRALARNPRAVDTTSASQKREAEENLARLQSIDTEEPRAVRLANAYENATYQIYELLRKRGQILRTADYSYFIHAPRKGRRALVRVVEPIGTSEIVEIHHHDRRDFMPRSITLVPEITFLESRLDSDESTTLVASLDAFSRHGEIAHQFMKDMFEIGGIKEF